jgi:hypothetical protein
MEKESEERDANTVVLLKSVEGMMNVIQTQANVYKDLRKHVVDHHIGKRELAISGVESFCVSGALNNIDLVLFYEKLGVLSARLRQLEMERSNAIKETEEAFKQLNAENERLREELTSVRGQLLLRSVHSE